MWQSWVEIEHYSVAQFDHVAQKFRKGMVHMHSEECLISLCSAYEPRP